MTKAKSRKNSKNVAEKIEPTIAPKLNAMIFDAPEVIVPTVAAETAAPEVVSVVVADQSSVTEQQNAIVAQMMLTASEEKLVSAIDAPSVPSVAPETGAITETDVIAKHALMLNALDARIADAPNDNQVDFFKRMKEKHYSVHETRALMTHSVDVAKLARTLGNSNKNDSANFVAKYALEKVLKVARALAQNSFMQLDKYTQSIALNMRALESTEKPENKQKIRAKTALACLSSAIGFDETDLQQAYKQYGNCVAATASTQRSSTREALRALGAADASKNVRDDAFTFTDAPIADALRALCDNAIAKK